MEYDNCNLHIYMQATLDAAKQLVAHARHARETDSKRKPSMRSGPDIPGKATDANIFIFHIGVHGTICLASIESHLVQQLNETDGVVSQALCCRSHRALSLGLTVQTC